MEKNKNKDLSTFCRLPAGRQATIKNRLIIFGGYV
jgi:hypothetical protein